MKDLKNRVMVAAVFGTVVILSIYLGDNFAYILFGAILTFSLWELGLIQIKPFKFARVANLSLSILFYVSVYMSYKNGFNSDQFAFILMLMFCLMMVYLFLYNTQSTKALSALLLSIFYLGLPFSCIFYFQSESGYDASFIMGILICIWASDSGAYFIGSKFGKRKLYPSISPNKSVEGAIGGLIFALLFGLIWHQFWPNAFELKYWIPMILIISIFGIIGDLVQSAIKRQYNVKDAGQILGSHGGFLDRFDAFIFMSPFLLFFILYIKPLY